VQVGAEGAGVVGGAEHAVIDPLLNAIDAAVADPDAGPERFGNLTDGLITAVGDHLRHEEQETLPLIDATLSQPQWQHFTEVHGERVAADISRFLPWLLDSSSPASAAAVLDLRPGNVRGIYQDVGEPAYLRLDLWSPRNPAPRT
jgi:hypothetical protein